MMTEELTATPISEEENTPATHGDLDVWGGQLQSEIEKLKQGQESLRSGQQAILQVIQSIDAKLTPLQGIADQVKKNTDEIHKLKMRP